MDDENINHIERNADNQIDARLHRDHLKKLNFLLIAAAFILLAICLVTFISNNSRSHVQSHNSSIITNQYFIELYSASEQHHALVNSEFELRISPLSAEASAVHAQNEQAAVSQLHLQKPIITLQMVNMNCGIVKAELLPDDFGHYRATVAPLMKGVWLATAAFQLEHDDAKKSISLSYLFEVL